MKTKSNPLKLILTALAALLVSATLPAHAMEPAEPKVIGLMFYSDTCGSCKVLDPKIAAVKPEFLAKPILFAKLDHSNPDTKNQAALLADSLGLADVYKAQAKASGFLLLVNPDNQEVLAKITRDMSEADIKAALSKSLQG